MKKCIPKGMQKIDGKEIFGLPYDNPMHVYHGRM